MIGSRAPDRLIAVALAGAVLAACASEAVESGSTAVAELAGRTAGEPQRCVPIRQGEAMRLGDRRLLLYGSGRTLWVNRLGGGCRGMNRNDILILEPTGASHCRGDRVRSMDPATRMPGPVCVLDDFVPYRR